MATDTSSLALRLDGHIIWLGIGLKHEKVGETLAIFFFCALTFPLKIV
jgi:hypothetical protein